MVGKKRFFSGWLKVFESVGFRKTHFQRFLGPLGMHSHAQTNPSSFKEQPKSFQTQLGIRLGIHFITTVTFTVAVMLGADGFHVVSINEQFRSLTWADAMVNRCRYLFTPNTINDALACWIQSPEPQTELLPTWLLVEHPDFITALVFVCPLLCLLIVPGTVSAASH
jgi:hypothetical protein